METLREGSRFYVLGRKHCANLEEKHQIALFYQLYPKNETIGTWCPMFPGETLASLDSSPDGAGAPQGLFACGGLEIWGYHYCTCALVIQCDTHPWYLWWEQTCDFFGGFTNQPWSQLPGGQGTRCLIEQVHWEEDKCVELVSNRRKGCQVHANMFDSVWFNWV